MDEVRLYTRTGDIKYHLGTSNDRPTRGKKTMVINVGYNQLDPLLGATGYSDGDVNLLATCAHS